MFSILLYAEGYQTFMNHGRKYYAIEFSLVCIESMSVIAIERKFVD